MPKITEPEYSTLKTFFVAWEAEFPPHSTLPPEHHPVAVLNSMEKKSPARARQGLGMAINDILEQSWGLSRGEVANIDKKFADKGIVSLSELRRRYSRQFRALIKRRKIRTETEYYLAQGVLASFSADATEEEQILLEEVVTAYEMEVTKKRWA